MTVAARVGARCASHPARPAVDSCPVCGRDRCAVDAGRYGGAGCEVCGTGRPAAREVPPGEVVVRAGLAALVLSYPTAWVAAQYVNVQYWSVGWPALLGLGVSGAAAAAAGARDRRSRLAVLVLAAAAAVLGTALGFRLFGRPVTPVHPLRQVWLPYVAALIGVVGWPLLFGLPGRPRRGSTAQPPGGTSW